MRSSNRWTRRPSLGSIAALGAAAALGLVVVLALAVSHPRSAIEQLRRHDPPGEVVLGPAAPEVHTRAGARAAGERFLRTYIAYLYGRIGANDVQSATIDLRRALDRARVRVPPARAERSPTIVGVRTGIQHPGVVRVTATVDDGDLATYAITVLVERRDGRWLVNDLVQE